MTDGVVFPHPIRSERKTKMRRKWRKAGEPVAHDTTQPFLLEERPFSSLSAHLIIFFFFYIYSIVYCRSERFVLFIFFYIGRDVAY